VKTTDNITVTVPDTEKKDQTKASRTKSFTSPIYNVIAVPFEKIVPNTYNPNSVAPPELKLLYDSIKEDGYTMPIVCYYDKEKDQYVIVDGFHRYRIMLEHRDIYLREHGKLPVSVIDKPIDQRMASTIRHNRARGSHKVDLMSNIIKELHELGRSDAWISKHLGMERDEILRLKQITGLAALFKDINFGRAWYPAEEDLIEDFESEVATKNKTEEAISFDVLDESKINPDIAEESEKDLSPV